MVLFALSCFGLLLFLWLAFGGPVPLKPKGYRFQTSFAEAGQLALEADVRISGVPVGKVKTITPDKQTGRCRRRDPAAVAVRAAAVEREGDPAPEDAAGRDLRGAHARRPERGDDRRRRELPSTAGVGHGRARRDPALVRPGDARRLPGLDADAGAGDLRPRPGTSTTRSATSAPFAEDTATIVDILNRQEEAVSQLVANTGIVFQALTERDGQLRSLIENSNTVFATTASRDAELQATFRALPTFEHESRITLERLTEFADETDPLDHAAAAGRARAVADARGPRGRRAGPEEPARAAAAADRRLGARLPGRRADARGPAPAARAARTRRPRS